MRKSLESVNSVSEYADTKKQGIQRKMKGFMAEKANDYQFLTERLERHIDTWKKM